MSLIDLKTDLKSLKYGDDQPGGGYSGQPYVQSPIPNAITTNVNDSLVRGGTLGAAQASYIDSKRIYRFLKDKPKGPLFIAKQIGLQLSNPKLEVKKKIDLFGILTGDLSAIPGIGGTLQPTRLYNAGINTLAQVGANAFGAHFDRHGLTPVQDDNTKYLAIAQANNGDNGKNNRLVGYKKKFDLGDLKTNDSFKNSRLLSFISKFLPISFAPTNQTIDNYIGGPGSTYGIGNTLIKRYDNTEDAARINEAEDKSIIGGQVHNPNNNNISILDRTKAFAKGGPSFQVLDVEKLEKILPTLPSVKTYKQIKAATETSITQSYYGGSDASGSVITGSYKTKSFVISDSAKTKLREEAEFTRTYAYEDENIVPIKFTIIDAFGRTQPDLGSYTFSSYIKGFKDSFSPTWNEVNYVGRAESFYTYQKFKRSVSFNLDIPCYNVSQLKSKHKTLEQLALTTAGGYNNNVLGGVFMRLKVGNYLNNQYAIMTDLSYDIPDDSSWDIDYQLSMYIKASFAFNIIHDTLPQHNGPKKNNTFFNVPTSSLPPVTPATPILNNTTNPAFTEPSPRMRGVNEMP